MAATTDPNAVYYSYRGVGTNTVVQKFIDLLDKKGIPHRGSESEPINGALTAFEEKIGAANIIVIFYSQEYFESEHCMNEYANIRKYENEARKAATFFVKCGDYDINGLVNHWGGQQATIKNKQFKLTPIEDRSLANGCYLDTTTLYCVQNLDDYFSTKVRYNDNNLDVLVGLIEQKDRELRSINTSANTNNKTSFAPSFKVPKPQTNLIERNDKVERLHDLVSKNDFTNLYGFGGSGKTSLTHLFVDKYRSDFNQIAYVVVNNSVKADFVSQINDTIHLFKPEEDKATQDKGFRNIKDIIKDTNNREKVDRYKSIIDYLEVNYKSDKPNLFIIDINNADDAEKFGEDLVNNTLSSNKTYPDGWKYLIVSRENIYKGLAQLNLNEKEQDIVHTDFLKKLFLKYVGDKYNNFSDGDFAELFETIYYSPLMAEQLGIYLKGMPKKSVSQIKEILHKNNFKNEKRSGITSQNRSSEEEKTIIGFLKNIIVFDKLSVGEQILLKHFVLWPTEYIPKEVIWQLLSKTFESEKNRFTKLWSIVKRYFTPFGEQQRIGVFFNRTKRYAVSKLWFYILLVLFSLSFLTSLLSKHNLIVSYSFLGIVGMLMYLLLEIVYNSCTFRSPFRNCARIAFGATIGLLFGLISSYTSLPKLFDIFAFLGAPFMISFFPFLKKIINCLLSKSYTNIDQDCFDGLLSDLSKRGVISENEDGNEKCYKLHGLIAESLRAQIDIPNTDYSDYIDSIKRIAKYDENVFEPFATCIGYSLSTHLIAVDDFILFIIASKSSDNASTAKYAAQLYQVIIDHKPINIFNSYKIIITISYFFLGFLQEDHLKDYDSAKSNYKKAIAIGEQLPKGNPEYQIILASAYYFLANLQEDHLGDYNSAKSNYEKAITILEKLPKDHLEYQNSLAGSYNKLAYTYDKLKEYDKAIESINTANDIAFQLKETDSKYLIDWINYRHSLAEIKFNNGKDLDEVKSILAEIKPLAQQCLKDNPNDKRTTLNDDIDDLLSKVEKSIS
ncbi:MAG: tetratricopeptide repeat protein [Bacteroidales bacterium]|nr:tetratricopeptide repeat protein [Bacteroidales bacterium]